MIIDGHTHLGKWRKFFTGLNVGASDLNKVLKESNIDRAVVFKSDAISNREVLDMIRDDDRFIFFWWAKERDDFSEYEDEIRGFKIHPTIEEKKADYFKKHLAYAEDKHLPVLIHCGRSHPISSYQYALDVVRKYDTNFILAHMGGAAPEIALQALAAAHNISNVYFGIEGIIEPWLLKKGIKMIGPERFIFGSDFPISHPRIYLSLVNLACREEEKNLILCDNISRILEL